MEFDCFINSIPVEVIAIILWTTVNECKVNIPNILGLKYEYASGKNFSYISKVCKLWYNILTDLKFCPSNCQPEIRFFSIISISTKKNKLYCASPIFCRGPFLTTSAHEITIYLKRFFYDFKKFPLVQTTCQNITQDIFPDIKIEYNLSFQTAMDCIKQMIIDNPEYIINFHKWIRTYLETYHRVNLKKNNNFKIPTDANYRAWVIIDHFLFGTYIEFELLPNIQEFTFILNIRLNFLERISKQKPICFNLWFWRPVCIINDILVGSVLSPIFQDSEKFEHILKIFKLLESYELFVSLALPNFMRTYIQACSPDLIEPILKLVRIKLLGPYEKIKINGYHNISNLRYNIGSIRGILITKIEESNLMAKYYDLIKEEIDWYGMYLEKIDFNY